MGSDKKKWNKTEKDRKKNEKKNHTDENGFSENEKLDWSDRTLVDLKHLVHNRWR